MELKEFEIPTVSFIGTAFGLTVSEFISEFVARLSGYTAWMKFGVKAAMKALIAVTLYGLAGRASGMWSLGLELATYGTLGSVVLDFFMAWNPGGIIGWAEQAAVAVRGASRSTQEIAQELAKIETQVPVQSRM